MARILETLPGKYHTESFSAKRIVSQIGKGDTARLAMQIVAQRQAQKISDAAPVDTGDLSRSVTIKAVVGGANPRMDVKTLVHGAYQEHGTTVLSPRPFMAPVMKKGRAEWEADVKATKATLDKKIEAAEKKERGPERDR